MEPLVLRVPEAASLLAIGQDEMRHLLHAGEVAGFRTGGGHWRVSTASLHEYVERRCQQNSQELSERSMPWPLRAS